MSETAKAQPSSLAGSTATTFARRADVRAPDDEHAAAARAVQDGSSNRS
jgi:hypothetical protein